MNTFLKRLGSTVVATLPNSAVTKTSAAIAVLDELALDAVAGGVAPLADDYSW